MQKAEGTPWGGVGMIVIELMPLDAMGKHHARTRSYDDCTIFTVPF